MNYIKKCNKEVPFPFRLSLLLVVIKAHAKFGLLLNTQMQYQGRNIIQCQKQFHCEKLVDFVKELKKKDGSVFNLNYQSVSE